MQSSNHLYFDSHIGRQKPESIINRGAKCPFCDRENLRDILAEDGPILLIKNKYPVLQDAFMTVLIETDNCEEELSTYTKDHLHRVFRFGLEQWLKMDESGLYASVLFFKNHGPLSGGSIYHPHMQIIGLRSMDVGARVEPGQFEGIAIERKPHVEFNLSVKPKVGFHEFNIIMDDPREIEQTADYTQTAVHYVLNHAHRKCASYNLFFYRWQGKIVIKVMPRYPTSPIYIGYSVPQVSNRLDEVVDRVRSIYGLCGRRD